MLSISILEFIKKDSNITKQTIKENFHKIKKLDFLSFDFLHLDIMDGNFVSSTVIDTDKIKDNLNHIKHPLDIHLMVENVIKYVDLYEDLKPTYITFHIEAARNPVRIIEYIKKKNIQVGLAINPNTDIKKLLPYLNMADLVLLMSVEPGYGKQNFIDITDKLHQLIDVRNKYQYSFFIEVDGGINHMTAPLVKTADIIVVGSYITTQENYKAAISRIQNCLK